MHLLCKINDVLLCKTNLTPLTTLFQSTMKWGEIIWVEVKKKFKCFWQKLGTSCVCDCVFVCDCVCVCVCVCDCVCWSLWHAEQLLFSCLCSKVTYDKCQMSTAYVDPWDMLNNFGFHVYAQKWHMSNVKCQMKTAYIVLW